MGLPIVCVGLRGISLSKFLPVQTPTAHTLPYTVSATAPIAGQLFPPPPTNTNSTTPRQARNPKMGIPSTMRDAWIDNRRRNAIIIASPLEEKRVRDARHCTQEGVRAGARAAVVAAAVSAVPTLVAVRVVPWAKANLNYTAQALIISAASIAAYFITADKTILECARRNAEHNLKEVEKRAPANGSH
ncbi:hypothetical protein Droror1_Dr00017151 [Drosera rotundifolia]